MKAIVMCITCLLCLACSAQQPKFTLNDNTSRIDSLYTEILFNLAHRKDNIQKNGPVICMPRFSEHGFNYYDTFIKEGGLKELADSIKWSFIKMVPKSYTINEAKFNKPIIKKLLAARNVLLSEKLGLRTGFEPIIFNKEKNRGCVIYYDFFSASPGTGIIANRIIAFYSHEKGMWNKVATIPLSLE